MSMRLRLVVVLFVFVTGPSLLADEQQRFHVRALDPWAAESITRAESGSATVRALVTALTASDVIVHVETAVTLPHPLAGMTRLLSSTGNYRYLRIVLDRDLDPHARAATLAHELQHAVEIARAGVRTDAAMKSLYQRIGFRLPGAVPYYETADAQRAGARARSELRGGTAAAAHH